MSSSTADLPPGEVLKPSKSASILRLRWRRFRRLKRGYWSFLVLVGAYLLSFLLPLFVGGKALVVRYQGTYFFPAARSYLHDTFGLGSNWIVQGNQVGQAQTAGEADYRALKQDLSAAQQGDFVWMPLLVPYGPNEVFLKRKAPAPPSYEHWLGTDTAGRDMLARLFYGYRISVSFALLVTVFAYLVGTITGALLGYYGRWLDILGLRLVEIWSTVPFLYTVMILASIFNPSFTLLVIILGAFGWMGITYYVRGEYYREKAKDYVAAALASGEGDLAIMFRHILPNALTPIIAFAPFAIVGEISALVALDFLGYGLPEPTPSWGELLRQAKTAGMKDWHLVVFPITALFLTLQLTVFIGEAVREAFDPKVFSRLR